ncbi:MAG: type II secretion system F family protein [Bacteroidota bacterium]|nr:type II secretion system F family protein [Bacteroidota bacterium]
MELLIGADIPLTNALALVRRIVPYYPIRDSLKEIEADVMQGRSLFTSMQNYSVYDKKIISLIKVGEEVNQLEKSFHTLKEQYLVEVDHKTALLSSVIEPVLIVFIGGFVAAILIAMYLPIFQMSTSFQ